MVAYGKTFSSVIPIVIVTFGNVLATTAHRPPIAENDKTPLEEHFEEFQARNEGGFYRKPIIIINESLDEFDSQNNPSLTTNGVYLTMAIFGNVGACGMAASSFFNKISLDLLPRIAEKDKTPLEEHFEEFQARNEGGSHRKQSSRKGSYKMKNRRDSRSNDLCTTCLKAALQVFNVIILILGLGCTAAGIWLLVAVYNLKELAYLFDLKLLEVATFLLLGGGCFITLMAICGCCGTMRMDKCIIGFYAFILIIVFLALVVGSALAFASRNVIIEKIKENYVKTISEKYGTEIRTNSEHRLITDAWDSMQKGLKCCGVSGDVNSTESWAIFKLQTRWYTNQKLRYPYVPKSCCADNDNGLCDGTKDLHGPPMWGPPVKPNHKDNPYLFKEGCFDVAFQYLKRHAVILGIIAATIPIFLVAGIVISCCLCIRVPSKTDDDYDSDEEENL